MGDLDEAMAAAYYGCRLEPPGTPGYDLITRDGLRVQVRALTCTPENFRKVIGTLREPYDVLFAIRLHPDYSPLEALEALEAPKVVVDDYFGGRRVNWTKKFAADSRVRKISAEDLRAALAPVG